MKKIYIFILLLLSISLYSENIPSIESLFNQKELVRLKNGEIITRMFLKTNPQKANTDLKLVLPKTDFTPDGLSSYDMITDEKAFIPYILTDETKLKLFNTLTGYSKLKDMVYYSRRISQVQTLILNSYKVESVSKKKQISDKTYTEILPFTENYYFQEDNKFGKFIFKSQIFNKGDDFVMVNTAVSPSYPTTKLITFFIYDKQIGGYFYYSVDVMNFGIGLAIIASKTNATLFSNRLRAGTVHLAKMLGLNWMDKINPWDETKLNEGKYRNY